MSSGHVLTTRRPSRCPAIVALPDEKTLREVSKPLACIGSPVKKPWGCMMATMYHVPAVRLADIQIGVQQRLLAIDLSKDGKAKVRLLVANPLQ